MANMSLNDLLFFDPNDDHTMAWKRLPHLAQAGTLCFITWRTADSLPAEAFLRLKQQREDLLEQYKLDRNGDWKKQLGQLPPKLRALLHWSFFRAWDDELDKAAGACVLQNPALSGIVIDSLLHFDNERYVLTDAVIMPNHVHVIAAFRDEDSLLKQCTSWKHFTATQINRWLSKREVSADGAAELRRQAAPSACDSSDRRIKTSFWQVEQFDHAIRSPEDFSKYRRYIAKNPEMAGLQQGSFRHYTREI
jgi:putative transposase